MSLAFIEGFLAARPARPNQDEPYAGYAPAGNL